VGWWFLVENPLTLLMPKRKGKLADEGGGGGATFGDGGRNSGKGATTSGAHGAKGRSSDSTAAISERRRDGELQLSTLPIKS